MKLSLPSVNTLMSALRTKLSASGHRIETEPAPADPRALVGANDSLTGLPGLTAFEGLLAQAVRRADAESRQLAVLFVNLDDLKSVNMAAGRPTGDNPQTRDSQRLGIATDAGCP